ncbi:MAG: citrate/2-methylcitrate synthase [Ruminococcus sp.]|nr:citrate/2-methylcitrate synthase [Ruminococcus sp.]MDD6634683.1 citrate/2-methylcitrate synthase [Ruminococcus sp.]CDF02185.1 citrate synthase [Ruminococcus sp. CAG:624]
MGAFISGANITDLCKEMEKNTGIDPKLYEKFHVKRGLRRSDGTGVVAGITNICNVHGYILNEGEVEAIPGELIYRGYSINDLVANVEKEDRFGYEETVFLLLFGNLPTASELEMFNTYISLKRDLPSGFVEDMILKAPSKNIMNKLARSVLALYSYDDESEGKRIENEMRTAISLIAKLPVIMSCAYQVKRRHYDNASLIMHPIRYEENTAQTILSMLRTDRQYTKEEAQLLDTVLMLQAEHGGGNNSTFTCRVLTSSGTDPYSAYAGAIGSLKGHRHGGANIKVIQMLDNFKENIKNWEDEGEVADYMRKVIRKEANDHTGLIYGMGHAVYTISDPRAVILKKKAMELAKGKEIEAEFRLLETVERLTPEVFKEVKGSNKTMCANVDMYSGLVYRMLGIPDELFTPIFAVSRLAGWSAHRMEEILTGGRIIRPAYKAIAARREYKKIDER